MSQSANQDEEIRPESDSDQAILEDLLEWGKLLSTLVQILDPFYQLDDLLQTDHPLADSDKPLGVFVRNFGKGTDGASFLIWWTGADNSLPFFDHSEQLEKLLPLGLAHRWRAAELQTSAFESFRRLDREWVIFPDRMVHSENGREAVFSKPLGQAQWNQVEQRLPKEHRQQKTEEGGVDLEDEIERVRSFFAPLESPLFGMDTELLDHHVKETIPLEGLTEEDVTPIVPLFGNGQFNKAFPSTARLPAHLRVILHRLVRSQENKDVVTSLLSTLEAVDFSLRFATGLGQGTLAELKQADFAGDFNPTTQQIVGDIANVIDFLPSQRDEPVAQAALHLLFKGNDLHPFLKWAGFQGEPRLLDWMMEAEDTIRHDIPARAAALLAEMMEVFNDWISELTLLCSSWDLVTHIRQDGYLQISLGRGEVWLSCKPLIDPTRYSVWLDRSELTLVNTGGSLNGFRDANEPVESLDDRIKACAGDPPFLAEQLTTLVRAHEQGQILPLGRALFFGLEYLVRLHASLAAGYLRHFYDEVALTDPVLKEGGSLEHTIYFLSFSQRIIGDLNQEEGKLLRQVFFDEDQPRDFTCWLGLDGGVPGPLQGLLGWSLSLMRPDAKTRLDEVRGQVERLSSLFADFLAESRRLWQAGKLQTDATSEGAEAVVLTFPNGLRLRGFPDVIVAPRLERGRRSVVVCGADAAEEEFSDWEGEDYQAEEAATVEESVEEPSWPSFFDDSDSSITEAAWPTEVTESISRVCQARTYSGPEARPRRIAQEIADVVSEQSSEGSSVLFCQGGEGAGKTLLCRTLTNPNCSPLPEDYPVLYLRVDRFPQTRLATVVERLNDHIASEQSLERFDWTSVPLESLKALGSEVARLADDLSALGVSSEALANRLASYLRQLKKINNDRSFLLILDGFERVPHSIVPSALPPGVNLLITGTEFGEWDFPTSSYTEYRLWSLDERPGEPFQAQLQGLAVDDAGKQKAFSKFGGSLFLARTYRDLRLLDDAYPVSSSLLDDLFSLARTKFREDGFEDFQKLLAVLGLYDRPVPLNSLKKKVPNGTVVQQAVEAFPGLFSFWDEPTPSLGLGHRHLLNRLRDTTPIVESVATELAENYLEKPRRGELLAALSWFVESDQTDSLVDRFFTEPESSVLWRQELASLQEQGLFFHRVALLDAAAEPLGQAVQAGAGHLQEELAWVHNARGLSLLELGLVEEALADFERAIELFSAQFASGDLHVLQAMASAHSRLSEASLQTGDLERALNSSARAQELLKDRNLSEEDAAVVSELRSRILLQSAKARLAAQNFPNVLEELSLAIPDLEQLDQEKAKKLRGEYFLVAAQAMAAQGLDGQALEQADTAVQLLMQGSTAELGLQALILRARLGQKVGRTEEAERDFQRALSVLRYHVAVGRMDLEPLLAYTAAQSLLATTDPVLSAPDNLTEFVDWARTRIRQESRSDLRGLLAFLLLTRGARWKDMGDYTLAAADLRQATEQYDLLSRETKVGQDQPVWTALRQSFRNLTALYLSLDEPHLALICGRRALELGRRGGGDHDSAEESLELPLQALAGPPKESEEHTDLSDIRFFQLGKLYFHLGEAARRVGLNKDGVTYFERSARSFAQTCSDFSEVPPVLIAEYALVLKFAAQAAFEDANFHSLQEWVDELASLPDGYLTDFDQYRYWRWSGHTLQAKSQFAQAEEHFGRAVKAVSSLTEHPRRRSLEAESLLDLGRALSLQGKHEDALARLDQAAHKAHDALFAEGEENRELLVLCALHSAVAHLRSGRVPTGLEQLRILVSLRPGQELHEVEALAQDWAQAWKQAPDLSTMDSLKYLGQLSELGDWLLRTSLGEWYRELALSVINSEDFETIIMSSSRIDRILETYLILTFSRLNHDTRPESNPELERLLAAKFRAFDSENRDIEAELLMGHLLPLRLNPEAGRLLLRRSEMALLRGDRGLAIIDLLRAIDAGGDCRLRAHLRLAEFLQSRGLEMAAVHHLLRALRATDSRTENLSSLSGRFSRVVTRLGKSGAQLELGFYQEYFRVLGCLDAQQLKPPLEVSWLRPARDQQDWPILLNMTLDLVIPWQEGGHDKPDDWAFLDEVLDRTVLCQGRLPLDLLEKLGKLLAATLATYDVSNRIAASALWERFATFLPALGKRDALALLQRLFEFTLRTESASKEGQADEFLRRLEEEKRILVQPR